MPQPPSISMPVDGYGQLMPWAQELTRFFKEELPLLEPQPWSIPSKSARYVYMPVLGLRWTHSGIDSRMIFAHDDKEGQSVYRTVDELWRGVITTKSITPLEVCLWDGALWSLSNRRLAALRMFQALNSHEIVWVRCVLRDHHHQRFDKAMSTLNGGLAIVPNRAPCGAPNVAEHFGAPVWQHPSKTACDKIGRLSARHPDLELLRRIKLRGSDEDSLTISSGLVEDNRCLQELQLAAPYPMREDSSDDEQSEELPEVELESGASKDGTQACFWRQEYRLDSQTQDDRDRSKYPSKLSSCQGKHSAAVDEICECEQIIFSEEGTIESAPEDDCEELALQFRSSRPQQKHFAAVDEEMNSPKDRKQTVRLGSFRFWKPLRFIPLKESEIEVEPENDCDKLALKFRSSMSHQKHTAAADEVWEWSGVESEPENDCDNPALQSRSAESQQQTFAKKLDASSIPPPVGMSHVDGRAAHVCCREEGRNMFAAGRHTIKLPSGWVSCFEELSKIFYWHEAEPDAITFNIPCLTLPSGWMSRVDKKSGNIYYWHESQPDATTLAAPLLDLPKKGWISGVDKPSRKICYWRESEPDVITFDIPRLVLPSGWQSCVDKESGSMYYWHESEPDAITWDSPPGVPSGWASRVDKNSETIYYWHESQPEATTWDVPSLATPHNGWMSGVDNTSGRICYWRESEPNAITLDIPRMVLPSGWQSCVDKESGSIYLWHESEADAITWNTPPLALPSGWASRVDKESGSVYYWHESQPDATTWHVPSHCPLENGWVSGVDGISGRLCYWHDSEPDVVTFETPCLSSVSSGWVSRVGKKSRKIGCFLESNPESVFPLHLVRQLLWMTSRARS